MAQGMAQWLLSGHCYSDTVRTKAKAAWRVFWRKGAEQARTELNRAGQGQERHKSSTAPRSGPAGVPAVRQEPGEPCWGVSGSQELEVRSEVAGADPSSLLICWSWDREAWEWLWPGKAGSSPIPHTDPCWTMAVMQVQDRHLLQDEAGDSLVLRPSPPASRAPVA